MSSTSAPTANPVLEFSRRKRTRSNLSVFTLPTSLAKRPHIEEISEVGSSARAATARKELQLSPTPSSSSTGSVTTSSDEISDDGSSDGVSMDNDEEEGSLQSESESEETSSSSSSSSSSAGSVSVSPSPSPSPSPTFNLRNPEAAANEPNTQSEIQRPSFTAHAPPSLASRLQAFLPAMRSANEELEVERKEGTLDARNIENIGDKTVESSGHIEMNLGLGVLEEKEDCDSDSDSDTNSESSSDITEALERPEGPSTMPGGTRAKADKDILGKLKGEMRRERPEIQVVDGND